jgi:STE24 endopeptidase
MNAYTLVFVTGLAAALALQLWLSARQVRHVSRHRDRVPRAFEQRISLADHKKAADYTLAQQHLQRVELIVGAVLLLAWTLGGGLDWLDQAWRSAQLASTATGVGVLVTLFAIVAIVGLPFAAYRTFVLEVRFGFNRTTHRQFLTDRGLELLLTVVLGAPLGWAILWLMQGTGPHWWLTAWLLWIGFVLLMSWAFPTLIAPLFNRFSPLPDDELRQRIQRLVDRCGFVSKGIFVMDGSRRSSHGNAYFTGLGNHKRIVFFDTLLEGLEHGEVEAVLAHELGHFKLRHVIKRLVSMALVSLGGLALLAWLTDRPQFYSGLGISQPSPHSALALFLLIAPVFAVFLQPVTSRLMRKHEYEADDFAARQTDALALVRALVKLYRDNASTLTPDPLYSAFHDSHPPAPLRIAHLTATAQH